MGINDTDLGNSQVFTFFLQADLPSFLHHIFGVLSHVLFKSLLIGPSVCLLPTIIFMVRISLTFSNKKDTGFAVVYGRDGPSSFVFF